MKSSQTKYCLLAVVVICLTAVAPGWAGVVPQNAPFAAGETITYDIKKLLMTVGETTVENSGLTDLDGDAALLITVTAQGFRFFDQEKIYLDPLSYHPLKIERDLDIFGVKEKIVEYYDRTRGRVRIVKTAKGKQGEQVIEKGERFDNIYGFIYRYRKQGAMETGDQVQLHLPTLDVTLTLGEKKAFKAAGRDFEAYLMESDPRKYTVWFDSGEKRLPLMIKGAVGFGNTSMIMRSYGDKKGVKIP